MRSQAALDEIDIKDSGVLYIGIDVGDRHWKLALTDGSGQILDRTIEACDFEAFGEYLKTGREHFGLSKDCQLVSCYEAGRDGFWIHRRLGQMGIANGVIDPGSLRAPKKGRRAKTDRIDAEQLVSELVRWCDGHRGHTFEPVKVPSPEDEDERQLFREHTALKQEKTRYLNRMTSLLRAQGVTEKPPLNCEAFEEWLQQVETKDGRSVSKRLKRRLLRIAERLNQVRRQLDEIDKERRDYLKGEGADENIEKARRLAMFRGISQVTAHALIVEMFGWREFQNRREVGAYVGLDGKRHDSGGHKPDQPITSQGNNRIRTLMIQVAHNWLRWQPNSELTQWARRRFGKKDGGITNKGVVALARKLLNRLRVLAKEGVPPRGAQMNGANF